MTTLQSQIVEREHAGMRLFAVRTGAKDVVTVRGSVLGGWNMLSNEKSQVASLTAELLDAGTSKRSKNVLREALAAKGISISFSASGDHMYFSGSCLPEDLNEFLKTVVECLGDSVFPATELKSVQTRAFGDLEEEKTSTRTQAAIAMQRMLYDPEHVNYVNTTEERISFLKSIKRSDILAFAKDFGFTGLVCAISGDVQPDSAVASAQKIFSKLPPGTHTIPVKKPNSKPSAAIKKLIPIPDKANIDVSLGVPITLTREDPLYLPFGILMNMLGGGGFTNHLMQTIRERDGLTYAVYAVPVGFGDGADGAFVVRANFSPDRFEESVMALRKEIDVFFKQGITQEKLDGQRLEMISGYAIRLATTGGIAGRLHQIGIEGKSLSYIDEYPHVLLTISLDELRAAAALIPHDALALAAAGTFA